MFLPDRKLSPPFLFRVCGVYLLFCCCCQRWLLSVHDCGFPLWLCRILYLCVFVVCVCMGQGLIGRETPLKQATHYFLWCTCGGVLLFREKKWMDPQCLKGRVSSYSVSVVRCLRHTCYHHKNVFLYIPLCLVGEGHTPTTVSTGEISSQHTQTLSQMKSFSTFVVVGVVLVLLLEGWACAGPRPSPNQRGHNLPGFFVPVEQVAGIPARTDTTKHGKDRLVWSHATNFSHPIKGHHASLSVSGTPFLPSLHHP